MGHFDEMSRRSSFLIRCYRYSADVIGYCKILCKFLFSSAIVASWGAKMLVNERDVDRPQARSVGWSID